MVDNKIVIFLLYSFSCLSRLIKPYLDAYIEIMNTDADFGALFVNYFALNNEKALDIFLRHDLLSPHVFVHYMNFMVNNRYFTKQSELNDKFLQVGRSPSIFILHLLWSISIEL